MAQRRFTLAGTRREAGQVASGDTVRLYLADTDTLAHVSATDGGSALPSSMVSLDTKGGATFWGPTDLTDELDLEFTADTGFGRQRVYADPDPRLDTLEADVDALQGAEEATGWVPWSVADFGAVGDGTTDNTAAFNDARDEAGTNGEIVVPEGTFLVDQIELDVAGQRWHLLPGAVVKLAAGAADGDAAFHVLAVRVTIRGPGTVDGNGSGQANFCHGIRTAFAYTTIDGVTVQNTKGNGIVSYGGSLLTIRDCTILTALTDGPVFIRPDSSGGADLTGVVVEGCFIDQSAVSAATVAGAGIKLIGYNGGAQVNDSRISGNRVVMPASPTGNAIAVEANYSPRVVVEANTTFGGSMGISVVACDRGIIDGNTVRGAKGYGIEAGCAAGAVTGNTVDLLSAASTVGIQVVSNGHDCAVSGNTVVGAAAGIQVQGCLRVPIVGNMVRAIGTNQIYLAGADGAVVSGNVLDGGGTCDLGISVDETSDLAITGNTIRNCDVKGIELYGDTAAYVLQHITITGNVFRSVGTVLVKTVSGGASVGSTVRTTGNDGLADYLDFNALVLRGFGTGTPEGAVAAGAGSTFQRTDGGAGTSSYVKESGGSGNTGWVAK